MGSLGSLERFNPTSYFGKHSDCLVVVLSSRRVFYFQFFTRYVIHNLVINFGEHVVELIKKAAHTFKLRYVNIVLIPEAWLPELSSCFALVGPLAWSSAGSLEEVTCDSSADLYGSQSSRPRLPSLNARDRPESPSTPAKRTRRVRTGFS